MIGFFVSLSFHTALAAGGALIEEAGMKKFFISLLMILLCVLTGPAQTKKTSKSHAPKRASLPVAEPPANQDRWRRKFWFFATVSSVFDSNINHDEEEIKSVGFVPSIGFHAQNDAENPSLEFEYEGALHRYTNTDKWNRLSNRFSGSYRKRVGRWVSRTEGGVLLKGSAEDRELANWYALSQRVEYRPTRDDRLQVFAAYRLKRDQIDPGSSAIDSYIGGRYVRRLGLRELEISYRYDNNRSWDPSNRYIRWQYEAQFDTPVFGRRNRLSFGGTYKPRLFAKTVKVNKERVPRRDERWIGGIEFQRALRRDLDMTLFYKYENRDSNDPDKKFNSHLGGVSFNYRW
jgi:hypothetical protein